MEAVVNKQESPEELTIKEIKERIKNTSIIYEENEVDDPFNEGKLVNKYLFFPAGRDKKKFFLGRMLERLEKLRDIPFEKFVFLNKYSAICSYELGVIEAKIISATGEYYDNIYRSLFGKYIPRLEGVSNEEFTLTINENDQGSGIRIKIGFPSLEGQILFSKGRMYNKQPTIRIEGLLIDGHDQAVMILEKISNSIFFEIDLKTELPLILHKEETRIQNEKLERGDLELRYPESEYDREPMYLYWYARSASDLPLLEFLAHYQTIEYYFPHYQENAAKSMVSNILKNPVFNIHNDSDLLKIISTVKSYTVKGQTDEKSQLISTLKEVVNIADLKDYINQREHLKNYYSKKDYKKISNEKINLDSENITFIDEVSRRIYDIRCKIVHTKASYDSGSLDLILPFSKEAEKLKYDIEVIRFISKSIIIAGGKQFKLL
jgi:hypothetical protein